MGGCVAAQSKINKSLLSLPWNRKTDANMYLYFVMQLIDESSVNVLSKTLLCLDVIDGLMKFSKYGTTMLSGRSNAGRLAQVTAP